MCSSQIAQVPWIPAGVRSTGRSEHSVGEQFRLLELSVPYAGRGEMLEPSASGVCGQKRGAVPHEFTSGRHAAARNAVGAQPAVALSRSRAHLSRLPRRLPPANCQWSGERQYVIQVDIQLVISICGIERFDDENVIEGHGNQRPHASQY